MENVLNPLAKSDLIVLGLTAAAFSSRSCFSKVKDLAYVLRTLESEKN